LNGRGLEGALKRGEGSKAHSKGGRVRKALPLMVEDLKAHSKKMRAQRRTQKDGEKYRDFSGGLILVGGLPRSKISQKWKIFKSIFNFGPF
jgi:hypothetical protein